MKKETDNSKTKKHSSALQAASIGRSATEQVTHHSGSGSLAMTGTNVSYEGATAPGGGGSVGTGYASGKQAVDATISANSDYAQNRGGSPAKTKAAAKDKEKDEDIDNEEDLDEDIDLDEEDDDNFDDDEEESK